MSGSPIMCENKLVGIYIGGPPLPGQNELWLINQILMTGDYAYAYLGLVQLARTLPDLYLNLKFLDILIGILYKCAILDINLNGKTNKNCSGFLQRLVDSQTDSENANFMSGFLNEHLIGKVYKVLLKNMNLKLILWRLI